MESERKIYQLTERDMKKAISEEEVEVFKAQRLAEIDAEKKKLGKRYGLKKRDISASFVRIGTEYARGLGQGRLDKLACLPYTEERDNKNFNLGYYTGYTENPRNYLDGMKQTGNPNYTWFFDMKEAEAVNRTVNNVREVA